MHYEGNIFRPPSEARSLILQVTVGCSHNRCTFCGMYKDKKYREKDLGLIRDDIIEARELYPATRRVFLADGNALAMETAKLLQIMHWLRDSFPYLERIAIYAGPQDILQKTQEELLQLREAGLKMIYLGVESGDDELLREVRKGATAEEMIKAGQKIKEAEIPLSVTVISGLGGVERMESHARETARVLNAINPDYLGVLTLMILDNTPLGLKTKRGEFKPLNRFEVLQELRLLVQELQISNCIFRSNHASNYLPLKGVLAEDKDSILAVLDEALTYRREEWLRPEEWRGL
ncbi:radical SAM protein [Calderihabitans maritimus]|uniref:Radical SAM protein n=1 Tax=Calderihabitans maritimus TaxID=1246530 RepID=A0A1Z5HPQ6_9FIRM|nr:radical SAM protein [Calderihabitans maritimus]GAW91503.1 radical SAM protein [Calderihabitans maritimus]